MKQRNLILGNGGVKKAKSYEEDDELSGYVITLQNFDKLIKEGTESGTIIVTENKIIKDTDWEPLEDTEKDKITLITCVENEPEYRRCVQAVEKEEVRY